MSIWLPRRPLRATAILLFSALIAAGAPEREFARVDGYIRDHMGTPIVNAQVFVIGTAFSGLSDARGHYLITGIPAGPIDLRAAFVGYRPVVVRGVQVHAGLTTHQDFVLEACALMESGYLATRYHLPRSVPTALLGPEPAARIGWPFHSVDGCE